VIFTEIKLKGAYIIDIEPIEDERGFFARSWCRNEFIKHGLNPDLVQCNVDYKIICNILLDWFVKNKRDLPWRKTYEPYHVWISEIMLQQTQMDRGVEYFKRWMLLFPDIESLASASEQSILKAWEGLGYYSRARNIIKSTTLLIEKHNGQMPQDYDQLLALPGVGPYAAGAIMSIAFDRPCPVIDANVERLFARIGDIDKPMKDKAVYKSLQNMLGAIVKREGLSPRDFNQGLMEFGALVCTPKNPECASCPIQEYCRAWKAGTALNRPVKKKKQQTIEIIMSCAIIENEGKFFIQQRQDDDVWGGLWEFPGGRLKNGESAAEAAKRELYEETEMKAVDLVSFETVTHYYTRYRVTLHSFFCATSDDSKPKLHAAQQYRWVSLEGLSSYAFPSGHRQLISKLKEFMATA